jgi:acetylornithine deacetylase
MRSSSLKVQVDDAYVIGILSALVNIPSATGHEEACARYMVEEFKSLGMRPELQQIAPDRANAVGTLVGTGGGRDLILSGHMDTSYSGKEEGLDAPGFQPHAVIDGEYMVGLGARNMKCGLAAALGAVHALKAADVTLAGDLIIAGVAGEIEKSSIEELQGPEYEGYGYGTRHLVAHGVTADAAIVGESTAFRVSVGHVGSIWLRITVHGDLLHTALSVRDDVVHAVYQAENVVRSIREWIPQYQERTSFMGTTCGVTIGAVRSGNPSRVSRTPQTYRIYLDVRFPPQAKAFEVKREVRQLLDRVANEHPGLHYTVESYMVAPPALVDESESIVAVTRDVASEYLGTDVPTCFRGPMDDTGHFIDAGIPSICFGVPSPDMDPAQRRAGEMVKMDYVVQLSQMYANIAMKFCNSLG